MERTVISGMKQWKVTVIGTREDAVREWGMIANQPLAHIRDTGMNRPAVTAIVWADASELAAWSARHTAEIVDGWFVPGHLFWYQSREPSTGEDERRATAVTSSRIPGEHFGISRAG